MTALPASKWTVICERSPRDALIKIFSSSTFPPEAIEAAAIELSKRDAPSPCPNLYQWQKELAAKQRTVYDFDTLWRKACDEASHRETGFTSHIHWGRL